MAKPVNLYEDPDLQSAFAKEGHALFDRLLQVRMDGIANKTVKWQPKLEKYSKDERRDLLKAAVINLVAKLTESDFLQLMRYGLSSKNIKQLMAGELRDGLKVYSHLPDDFSRISLVPGYLQRPLITRMQQQVETMHGGRTLEQIEQRARNWLRDTGRYPDAKKVLIPAPRAIEIGLVDIQWLNPLITAQAGHVAITQPIEIDAEEEEPSPPPRREPHHKSRDRRPTRRGPRP